MSRPAVPLRIVYPSRAFFRIYYQIIEKMFVFIFPVYTKYCICAIMIIPVLV